MNSTRPIPRADMSGLGLIPMYFVSWLGLLFLGVVFIIKRHGHWHTGLFVWGLCIGVAMVLNQALSYRVFPRLASFSEEVMARRRRQAGVQRKLNAVTLVITGVTVGVLSGKTGFVWVDVALSVMAAVSVLVAWVTAVVLGRRSRRS